MLEVQKFAICHFAWLAGFNRPNGKVIFGCIQASLAWRKLMKINWRSAISWQTNLSLDFGVVGDRGSEGETWEQHLTGADKEKESEGSLHHKRLN